MVKRRERVIVLLDTNVLVRALANPHTQSATNRIIQLWLQRRIQLAVSPEAIVEYREILERLGVNTKHIKQFIERLEQRETVTRVNLGRRLHLGRDPEDEFLFATAETAKVDFLVTLDKDLLELSWNERRRFRFQIVTPAEFLKQVE
jgi:putative PIN family toxin of toxin-antitoxin system